MSIGIIEGWAVCWLHTRWSISRRRPLKVSEGTETWHWGVGEGHPQPHKSDHPLKQKLWMLLTSEYSTSGKHCWAETLFEWLKSVLLPATAFGTYQIFLQKSHHTQSVGYLFPLKPTGLCWSALLSLWPSKVKRREDWFSLWFGAFQCMVAWPHCLMFVTNDEVEHHSNSAGGNSSSRES